MREDWWTRAQTAALATALAACQPAEVAKAPTPPEVVEVAKAPTLPEMGEVVHEEKRADVISAMPRSERHLMGAPAVHHDRIELKAPRSRTREARERTVAPEPQTPAWETEP